MSCRVGDGFVTFARFNEDFGPLSVRAALSNRPVPWVALVNNTFLFFVMTILIVFYLALCTYWQDITRLGS
jgi:hypothetical protein